MRSSWRLGRSYGANERQANSENKEQPLIPALSPYEGEKENRSLVSERSNGLDFRTRQFVVPTARESIRRIFTLTVSRGNQVNASARQLSPNGRNGP
jgi:hypothetical protein